MPKSFKISLVFCGIAIVLGLVSGVEFGLRLSEVWKNSSFFRFSYLAAFFSVVIAVLANTWSLVRCLMINEPVYAVKSFLLYFFPIGAVFLLLIFVGQGV